MSPHVIRVWEKRYGAVVPVRTGTNRRLYSEEEVGRLRYLARATEAGHKISIIARLGLEDLRRLVATLSDGMGAGPDAMGVGVAGPAVVTTVDEGALSKLAKPDGPGGDSGTASEVGIPGGRVERVGRRRMAGTEEQVDARLVSDALDATRSFQADVLQQVLERGAVRLGHSGVLHRLVCPLAHEIGELWKRGEVTAAHEHFASAVIRDFLMRSARPYGLEEGAPRALVTTPAGQLHELGAVMAAAAAANLGWRTVYLGPSLPAAEIAGAALQNGVRVVLLSIVYPSDDRWLAKDLIQLRRLLPASVEIVVGGRAARAYAETLKQIGAIVPDGMEELCDLLGEIREGGEDGEG